MASPYDDPHSYLARSAMYQVDLIRVYGPWFLAAWSGAPELKLKKIGEKCAEVARALPRPQEN